MTALLALVALGAAVFAARHYNEVRVLDAVIAVPMTQIHWDGTQASTQADDIDTLLNVMIVLSSFVFAIVLVMLGYCVWKYRAKPGSGSGPKR